MSDPGLATLKLLESGEETCVLLRIELWAEGWECTLFPVKDSEKWKTWGDPPAPKLGVTV